MQYNIICYFHSDIRIVRIVWNIFKHIMIDSGVLCTVQPFMQERKCTMIKTYVIGIAGASASGKSTVSERLRNLFADYEVRVIHMDEYYREAACRPEIIELRPGRAVCKACVKKFVIWTESGGDHRLVCPGCPAAAESVCGTCKVESGHYIKRFYAGVH